MPIKSIDYSYTFFWSISNFFERPNHLYEKLHPQDFNSNDQSFIKSCMLGMTCEPGNPFASISVDIEYNKKRHITQACRLTFVIMDNKGQFHKRGEYRNATVGESGRHYYDIKDFLDEDELRNNTKDLLLQPSNTLRLLCRMRFVIKTIESVIPVECKDSCEKVQVNEVNRFRKLLDGQKFWEFQTIEGDNDDIRKAILGVGDCGHPLTCRMKNQDAVEVRDTDYEILKAVLLFMYLEKFWELGESIDRIPHEESFRLKEDCERDVICNLTVDNAVRVLILVDLCGCNELKRIIINFIGSRGSRITQTEIFKELKNWNPQLLEDILCKVVEKI